MRKRKAPTVRPGEKIFVFIFDIIIAIILFYLTNLFFRFNDYIYTIIISLVLAFTVYTLWGIFKLPVYRPSTPVNYKSEVTGENIIPYSGFKSYIFVSYAHRNSDRVDPILKILQDEGYRFWYDTEIPGGAEWDKYISEKIKKAAVFMPFVSHDYEESNHCKAEENFAVNDKKEMVPIFLDEGVDDMYFARHNGLNLYNNDNVEAIKNFFNHSQLLDQCRTIK